MIETIWRKDFQNSVEKTARAKGNYQDMETALFRRFKVEGKGYSPDIFSELQREPTQLTKFGAFNKLTSVFHASVLLLIINFVITLSK